MRTRTLGANGPVVSVIGLGCNNFGMAIDADAAKAVVAAALDTGITHFDTAESYGDGRSESMLGQALGNRRQQVVIATKARRRPEGERWHPGDLARRMAEGCEGSLRRLGTDYIDVYYEHHRDPNAPVDEALSALNDLVSAGKVRYGACSNYSAQDIATAAAVTAAMGWAPVRAAQIHWNLVNRQVEQDVVPAAKAAGMGIVPYYPLASGLLTGKYRSDQAFPEGSRLQKMPMFAGVATEENFATVERLSDLARRFGRSPGELAVAWVIAQPGVTSVIAGATTAAQVQANAQAASWEPTDDEVAAIAQTARPVQAP